jgi:ATP-dependent DNA helicase RecG
MAVVNACVHRTYSNGLRNADVFIKMFDDRLEVLSPGSFMPFVTPENVYSVVSVPRNPFLMGALKYLDFVKIAREGTRRMKATMDAMGLPAPEFKVSRSAGTHVTVILRNQIRKRRAWTDANLADQLGTAILGTLSKEELRYLELVVEHGEITVDALQRLTSMPAGDCKGRLDGLVQRGILSRSIGEGRSAAYRLPSSSDRV